MSKRKAIINSRILASAMSISLTLGYLPVASAADGELNFKVYSPDSAAPTATPALEGGRIPAVNTPSDADPAASQATTTAPTAQESLPAQDTAPTSPSDSVNAGAGLSKETPVDDAATTVPPSLKKEKPEEEATSPTSSKDTTAKTSTTKETSGNDTASGDSILDKSAETEANQTKSDTDAKASTDAKSDTDAKASTDAKSDTDAKASTDAKSNTDAKADTDTKASSETATTDSDSSKSDGNKVLKGYVQVVPSGTKIPIIMDTAVDSDTSQEGDEFSARTAEDLTIDGTTVIPAGSIIRGRIATINTPKHLDRSGSVALKFDTVTTPDNRQIPLVANLVARGGVVHARRGLKDVAIDTSITVLPALVGLGIGAVAGNSSSSVGVGGGALIGVGVGAVVGVAILLAKKGKKVDVRPGDELKIELAEDLHMPTM
jgi:hypothetical protein